jgi:hypothetical protein
MMCDAGAWLAAGIAVSTVIFVLGLVIMMARGLK